MHTGSEKLEGRFRAVNEDRSGGILVDTSISTGLSGSIRFNWIGGVRQLLNGRGGDETAKKQREKGEKNQPVLNWFLLTQSVERAAGTRTCCV